LHVLDEGLDVVDRHRIDTLLHKARGAPYRSIDTLVFRPRAGLASIAAEFIKDHRNDYDADWIAKWLIRRTAASDAPGQADWATYLLFDGRLAERMITAGVDDAKQRRDEIRRFFGA
jgi:NTE family protein